MDIGTFWDIIETARASAGPDRPFHESLTDHLATLSEDDILEYHERFEKMHGALYRYDLWAAAYLIRGGCSDDSFIDFRAGLIAQGRDWYEQAMTSPDSLAGHPAVAGAGHPLADNPLFYEEVIRRVLCIRSGQRRRGRVLGRAERARATCFRRAHG